MKSPFETRFQQIVTAGENAEDLGSGDAGRRDGDGREHGRDHHARQQQARPGLIQKSRLNLFELSDRNLLGYLFTVLDQNKAKRCTEVYYANAACKRITPGF